jgi:FlaA1/EpsC-like NDP-sugar epimerase
MEEILRGKRILITGGTGSLGKVLTRRILSGELGAPAKLIIFSRDEAKQHDMRIAYMNKKVATDEIIYNNFNQLVEFRIGDVRDYHSILGVLRDVDIVFNAAALKQVPACEYFPYEAVQTNITGPENIVRAIRENQIPIDTVVGISTDKACKPVNIMGMTKAIQERIFITANLSCRETRFLCVRYGNVLASRGSVVPLFHSQIKNGGPVTITTADMTRFLLSLDDAVGVIFAALKLGERGDIFIPKVPSANVADLAQVLIGDRKINIQVIGIRPGEKIHEILISEEESYRTIEVEGFYVIKSHLPELNKELNRGILSIEFCSKDHLMDKGELHSLLSMRRLLVENEFSYEDDYLK